MVSYKSIALISYRLQRYKKKQYYYILFEISLTFDRWPLNIDH